MGRLNQGVADIPLPAGAVITVAVDRTGAARVTDLNDTTGAVAVSDLSPYKLGPLSVATLVRIDTLNGSATYSVDGGIQAESFTDRTETPLRKTVAAFSTGARKMSLADKFKALADRANSIPKEMGDRADALNLTWDSIERRGDMALAGHEAFAKVAEQGVKATEDALNQLTNGAPLE